MSGGGGATSLEAVKKKIKTLQDAADAADERASDLQRELCAESRAREAVSRPPDKPLKAPQLVRIGSRDYGTKYSIPELHCV